MQIVIYIDDTLVVASNVEQAIHDRDLVIKTLQKCGFTINYKKSYLTPSTVIEFLGFVLDSDKMTITLTEHKRQVLWKSIQDVLLHPRHPVSMQHLARIIGRMVAIFPASEVAGLHYRTLERFKIKGLLKNKSWLAKMILNYDCIRELKWWNEHLHLGNPSKLLVPPKFTLQFFSDASGGAWGALVTGSNANGPFSAKQRELSINTKELLAMFLGLQALRDKIRDHNVLCFCDNVMAVSCITKLGLQNVIRDWLTVKIFELAHALNCKIAATHLARSENSSADGLSRKNFMNERLEWSLDVETFKFVKDNLGFHPNIDLFASHLKAKIHPYCSYKRDPGCMQVDAFTLDWGSWSPYAFPPFSLLDRLLAKFDADKVRDMALVVPVWPTAPFFGTMLRHLKKQPVVLPPQTGQKLRLSWDPEKRHPVKDLRLALVHLCATCYVQKRCPQKWLNTLLKTPGTKGS